MNIAEVPVSVETRRGCGFRKGGGLYLVTDAQMWTPCGRSSVALKACGACSKRGFTCGIKPSRGWTWFEPAKVLGGKACETGPVQCMACPLRMPNGEAMQGEHGLLWIGEKFYPTPAEFMREAETMGVSRRISAVPRDFKLGTDYVFVAHRKHSSTPCKACKGKGHVLARPGEGGVNESVACEASGCDGGWRFEPGIFQVFKPTAIEYVIRGDESYDELDALVARGIRPVRVEPLVAQQPIVH